MSDHEVTYETTFTWGDGEQVELSNVEPSRPLDVGSPSGCCCGWFPSPAIGKRGRSLQVTPLG